VQLLIVQLVWRILKVQLEHFSEMLVQMEPIVFRLLLPWVQLVEPSLYPEWQALCLEPLGWKESFLIQPL
jgi:hypothetical protein